jgi:hypothetical protein
MGRTAMANLQVHDRSEASLVFVAHDIHGERCGVPPRLRDTDNLGLDRGDLENRYGDVWAAPHGTSSAPRSDRSGLVLDSIPSRLTSIVVGEFGGGGSSDPEG